MKFAVVTNGPESALNQTKAAAGHMKVSVIGAAGTTQQMIRLGSTAEFHIATAPVRLGKVYGCAIIAEMKSN